jgi:hypothetical protein
MPLNKRTETLLSSLLKAVIKFSTKYALVKNYSPFFQFGKTTKVQWDVINAFSISTSYFSSLPAMRAVGKRETYKVKACAYYALHELLQSADNGEFEEVPFPEAFTILLEIVEDIIFQESINMNHLGLSLEERSAFKLVVKK